MDADRTTRTRSNVVPFSVVARRSIERAQAPLGVRELTAPDDIDRPSHDGSRIVGAIRRAFRYLTTGVFLCLSPIVLVVLCLIGWLYGVWQNRNLRGMP